MKRRIFIGLALILILIAGIQIDAIILFEELGSKVDRTLRENYHSEVAGRQMKDSVGAMDFGIFLIVSGQEERGQKSYQESLQCLLTICMWKNIMSRYLENKSWRILCAGPMRITNQLLDSFCRSQIQLQNASSISNVFCYWETKLKNPLRT